MYLRLKKGEVSSKPLADNIVVGLDERGGCRIKVLLKPESKGLLGIKAESGREEKEDVVVKG
ncbi:MULTISPECIES: hypothetical protein [unclassified Archaeoglobus]|uniref:hypothetical protein n=1 Tax=unclassified Archaeoglobus TaxID=2643606 RepID=UPI0025C2BE09|nr:MULTISPECIES: hypothetical protein [unclassified Archaeoglobus]